MARPAGPHDLTLNAWDAQFWMQLPLPLAEVGSRLAAAQSDYLDRLLKLLEDSVALAVALALVRGTGGSPRSRAALEAAARDLAQPSLGKRIAVLTALERANPGSTGWDLDAPAQDLVELFGVLPRSRQVPRAPRLRDALEALTQIRNDEAHRRLPTQARVEVARVVEHAVFNLVRRNRAFYQRILHVDEVRTLASGDVTVTATSLNGPLATTYRRGTWQHVGSQRVLPKRIYVGEPDHLTDAHPFLFMRGGQVFVLDEVRPGGPVLRSFLSRARLEDDLRGEWDMRWPEWRTTTRSRSVADDAPTIIDPVGPVRDDPVLARPKGGSGARTFPLPLVAAMGVAAALLGVVVLVVAVAAVAALLTTEGGAASSRAMGAEMASTEPEAPRCRGRDILGMPTAYQLPQIFSGAPIGWGSSAMQLESACGPAPPAQFPACESTIVDMRRGGWALDEIDLPDRNLTTLAFHRELGLFEVMVYSNAALSDLVRAVSARLGSPHREEGSRRFWDYPRGAPVVTVKVTGLGSGHPHGRSAIKVSVLQIDERYQADRTARGCGR